MNPLELNNNTWKRFFVASVALIGSLVLLVYAYHIKDKYQLRFKFNPQQIGVVSLVGNYQGNTPKRTHYVGWFLSFADGLVYDNSRNTLRWGLLTPDGKFDRFGFRLLPRYYRLEMPQWHEDMFAK